MRYVSLIASSNPCKGNDVELPSEEFELTVNSLGAHIETHRKLILSTLCAICVIAQRAHHAVVAVSSRHESKNSQQAHSVSHLLS